MCRSTVNLITDARMKYNPYHQKMLNDGGIVVVGHLGRRIGEMFFAPDKAPGRVLGASVLLLTTVWVSKHTCRHDASGSIVLENLRFHPEEEKEMKILP